MTTKNNSKTVAIATTTVAAPADSLMGLLAQEIARQASAFKQTETQARVHVKQIVGAEVDLLTLQTMEAEAESLGVSPEFLHVFKAKAKEGRALLIEAEAAGQAARRLAATSTVEGLRAHLEKAKAANAAKAEQEKKEKAAETSRKANEAQEERIEKIVTDLGEITLKTAHAVRCFLRGQSWDYRATEGGRAALLAASGRAAAKFNKENKLAAREAKAAKEGAAPLTHKVIK